MKPIVRSRSTVMHLVEMMPGRRLSFICHSRLETLPAPLRPLEGLSGGLCRGSVYLIFSHISRDEIACKWRRPMAYLPLRKISIAVVALSGGAFASWLAWAQAPSSGQVG